MTYSAILLMIFLGSLIASLLLTRLLIPALKYCDIMDVPNIRSSHKIAVPRGGGLGLVIVLALFFPSFEYLTLGRVEFSLSLGSLLLPIALISFMDDIAHIAITVRFIFYILSSLLAVMWVIHPMPILHYEMPLYLDLILGTLALAIFLNIYNFLDGIDGLAMSETIHLTLTLLILCAINYYAIPKVDFVIALCVIILAWSIGFSFFNWHPAKIFLGDVGSVTLGFILGICLLIVASAGTKLFVSCVISALYYIADGGLTILIRLTKGEKIWLPHRQHFFQKSVQKGRSHSKVTKRIIRCNVLLMLFAVNALYYPIISVIGSCITVGVVLVRSTI
jgi:UDP-N-acetylmuramyl pentapeptide phosphotransferase/UDP-N-acetylglucosamine-1-phosphate transferase